MVKESLASLEMQVEELKDERRLYEGKADRTDLGGCGTLLLIVGAITLVFIEPISGGFALIAGFIILAGFSGGKVAREKVAAIDADIKRLRQKIVDMKS